MMKNSQQQFLSDFNQIKWVLYKFLAVLSFVLISVNTSSAAFVSRDHERFGSGSLTLDTSTNLQWLDIRVADFWSYNDVVRAMGRGGRFEGFRHATSAEVFQMLENFGFDLSVPFGTFSYSNFLPAENLISYMGSLAHGFANEFASLQGITADSVSENIHERIGAVACYSDEKSICTEDDASNMGGIFVDSYYDDDTFCNLSHWLIWDPQSTQPAPEPGTYSMLLLGWGIAVVAVRRRKRTIE